MKKMYMRSNRSQMFFQIGILKRELHCQIHCTFFFESHSANTQNISATTVKIRNHIKTHAPQHIQFTTHYFDFETKNCTKQVRVDQTIRQRKIENVLKIKAKNKAKDMQTTKKTLTTVKSVPLRMLESLTFLVLPKMSQGS